MEKEKHKQNNHTNHMFNQPINQSYNNSIIDSNPSISRVLFVFDRFSLWLSVMIRRHPSVRLSVAVYILLIHIWGIFILYHIQQDNQLYIGKQQEKHFGLGNG